MALKGVYNKKWRKREREELGWAVLGLLVLAKFYFTGILKAFYEKVEPPVNFICVHII